MAITIQFLLSWLSNVIPRYDQSVANYRKAKKQNKPNEIIQLIYDACLSEAQKNNAIEVQPHFHNAQTHHNIRHANMRKIKGRFQIYTLINYCTIFQPKKVL